MRYPAEESSTLEWKQEIPANDQIVKTLIGFCNQYGGKLILGVDDRGEVVGVDSSKIEQLLEYLDKSIFEACQPAIIPRISTQRFGEKSIIVIEVGEGMAKPYFRKSEGLELGTYLRLGRSTVRATPDLIQELRWQSMGIDFEATPCLRAQPADLDSKLIQHFLDQRRNGAHVPVSDEILIGYQLLHAEQDRVFPTQAGLLLFGRQPQRFLSEAMIICSHFSGTSGRQSIATVDCEGTLFNQFQQAYAFVMGRLYRSFQIRGIKREEQLEIPEVALREALLNAMVHRNYHIKAPTKIAIYDHRVEIFSPGGFAGPIDAAGIQAGLTYLRNPAICRVFRESGYIEKLGSGIITIFESYLERGLPVPEIVNRGDSVKVILPRPLLGATPQSADRDELSRLFSRSPEISLADVQEILGVSRSTATRKVNQWVLDGRLEKKGNTRALRFRLR
ncbi:MAG: RNA-binding domain-containing protein [Chlamydiia bacterium]